MNNEKQVVATTGEKFVETIFKIAMDRSGTFEASDEQRERIRRYFDAMDQAIWTAEQNRVKKNKNNKDHKWDETLEYKWGNVRVDNELAHALLDCSKLGLDMSVPNHLSPVLYKDKANNQYVFTLIPGYRGYELIAHKYALVDFLDVKVELVYSSDKFVPRKADKNNPYDTYEWEITNPFDRGEVVGGFAYVVYDDQRRNTLFILTKHDIEKRKPAAASANFWGGTAKEWVDGKQEVVQKEGWYEEMCRKTIAIYAYKRIPTDPQKIDACYRNVSDGYAFSKDVAEADYEVKAKAVDATVVDVPQIAEQTAVQAPLPQQVVAEAHEEVTSAATSRRPAWAL